MKFCYYYLIFSNKAFLCDFEILRYWEVTYIWDNETHCRKNCLVNSYFKICLLLPPGG